MAGRNFALFLLRNLRCRPSHSEHWLCDMTGMSALFSVWLW